MAIRPMIALQIAVPLLMTALANAESSVELPTWMKLNAELGVRADANAGSNFQPGPTRYDGLEHLRFQAQLTASRWFTFATEVHDARALGISGDDLNAVANKTDVRQAWIQFGHGDQRWSLRAGRQEISLGDERLIGADAYWDNLGRTFDAVQLTMQQGQWGVRSFAALVNQPRHERADSLHTDERLYGVYSSFKHNGGGVLEPYILLRVRRPIDDCKGHDLQTYGVRAAGTAPANLDYNIEMALQYGATHDQPVRAWSGHWEFGYRLGSDRSPRVGFEYNYASGDRDPDDGRHETFDDLYPAGFNKYGMLDPFGARNLSSTAVDLNGPWAGTGCFTGV